MITLSLHPPVRISAEDAEVLAGWLGTVRMSAAFSARSYLLGAVDVADDEPQLALSDVERTAIREALTDVEDLTSFPGLLVVREWLDAS